MAFTAMRDRAAALTAFQYGQMPSAIPTGTVDTFARYAAWWGYQPGGAPSGGEGSGAIWLRRRRRMNRELRHRGKH